MQLFYSIMSTIYFQEIYLSVVWRYYKVQSIEYNIQYIITYNSNAYIFMSTS